MGEKWDSLIRLCMNQNLIQFLPTFEVLKRNESFCRVYCLQFAIKCIIQAEGWVKSKVIITTAIDNYNYNYIMFPSY